MDDVRMIELLEIICDKLESIDSKLEDINSQTRDAANNTGYCETEMQNSNSKLDAISTLLVEIQDNQ